MILGIYLIGGSFMDSLALLLLTLPIFYPVSQQLGFDPLWFGVLLVIAMEMALITPPVGMNLFVIKGIARAPLGDVIRGTVPYVMLMLLGLAIVFMLPGLATWLPAVAGFGR